MSRRSSSDAVLPHQLRTGDVIVLSGEEVEVATTPEHMSTTKELIVRVVTPGQRAKERPREVRLPEWNKVERKRRATG